MDHEYNSFAWVQFALPIIGSVFVVCGMALTARFLKPDKAVRIMFPHINKHGNNTVMFGFILKKEYTCALFLIMLLNVFFTALVFWLHLVIDRSRKYNPFGDYKCFYSSTHTEVVNITAEEALTFDEDVECFAWTLNIGGAVGQATGTLLFAWVLVSVVTWIILNAAHKVNEYIEGKSLCTKMLGWISLGFLQGVVYAPPLALIGTGIFFFETRKISLLSFFDLLLFSLVLIFSSSVLWWYTEKEPKRVEDCCSELIEAMTEEKDSKEREISLNIIKRRRKYGHTDIYPQHPDLDPDERKYELDDKVLRNKERLLQRKEENANSTAKKMQLYNDRIATDKERIRLREERIRIDRVKLERDKDNFESQNNSSDREIERLSLDMREIALKEKEVQLARYRLLQELAASECERLLVEEAATHMDKKDVLEISKVAFAQMAIRQLCPATRQSGNTTTCSCTSTTTTNEPPGQAPINDGTGTHTENATTNTSTFTQATTGPNVTVTADNLAQDTATHTPTDTQASLTQAHTTDPIVNINGADADTSIDTNTTQSSINDATHSTINNNTPTNVITCTELTSTDHINDDTTTHHTISTNQSDTIVCTSTETTQPVTINSNTTTSETKV